MTTHERIRGAIIGLAVGLQQSSESAVADGCNAGRIAAAPRPADYAEGCQFAAAVMRAAGLHSGAAPTAGLIAGWQYGYNAIPLRWRAWLAAHDELLRLADRVAEAILGASVAEPTAVIPVAAIRRQHCTVLNDIGEAGA